MSGRIDPSLVLSALVAGVAVDDGDPPDVVRIDGYGTELGE